jgi:hypothetical protein
LVDLDRVDIDCEFFEFSRLGDRIPPGALAFNQNPCAERLATLDDLDIAFKVSPEFAFA